MSTNVVFRVAIVGSREFPGASSQVRCWLSQFHVDVRPRVLVISGGARGVDIAARAAAIDMGFQYREYPADWDTHGKAAGYIRNEQMVLAADKVIAFWDGQSKGTKHTIDLALKHRKNLEVIFP